MTKIAPQEEQSAVIVEGRAVPMLLPWRHWDRYFGFPAKGTVKYMLMNRKDSGFHKCVRRISGRLYLDTKLTLEYFASLGD